MLQWEDRLAAAETDEDVLFVASDFLSSLDYIEIARLPHACRPRPLRHAVELHSYMSGLVHQGYAQDDGSGSAAVIRRLVMFFARASDRLAFLERANDDHGSVKRTA
jgi:hypothetical protein